MRRDHKNLNVRARLAIEDVVRKPRHSIAPNTGGKLHAVPLRIFTNLDHRCVEGSEIPCAEPGPLLLVVCDVLKVFNPRRITEEVTHLSKAWA